VEVRAAVNGRASWALTRTAQDVFHTRRDLKEELNNARAGAPARAMSAQSTRTASSFIITSIMLFCLAVISGTSHGPCSNMVPWRLAMCFTVTSGATEVAFISMMECQEARVPMRVMQLALAQTMFLW
jgi:hypothetical protein